MRRSFKLFVLLVLSLILPSSSLVAQELDGTDSDSTMTTTELSQESTEALLVCSLTETIDFCIALLEYCAECIDDYLTGDVRGVISEITETASAIQSFPATYSDLPGDIPSTELYFPDDP